MVSELARDYDLWCQRVEAMSVQLAPWERVSIIRRVQSNSPHHSVDLGV